MERLPTAGGGQRNTPRSGPGGRARMRDLEVEDVPLLPAEERARAEHAEVVVAHLVVRDNATLAAGGDRRAGRGGYATKCVGLSPFLTFAKTNDTPFPWAR